MPRLDLDALPQENDTGYPQPFTAAVEGRWKRRLARAAGLSLLGATHTVLKPGAWSSQRHWHDGEDELLVMLAGEAVLVEDGGRTTLCAGDICAWPAGSKNGHHLINESPEDCSFVVVSAGDREAGGGYSDIDMVFEAGRYLHRDGTPYDASRLP
jgi:uncharacterized cupin superfamily protein